MQLHELILTKKFYFIKPGLNGFKVDTPLSALNSVRDFSVSRHACDKL